MSKIKNNSKKIKKIIEEDDSSSQSESEENSEYSNKKNEENGYDQIDEASDSAPQDEKKAPQPQENKRKNSLTENLANPPPKKQIKANINNGNNNNNNNNHNNNQSDEEEQDDENDIKWKYLEHHGVLFPDYWKKHNIKIMYDNKPIDLTLYQEEMATYWSQTLGTDWENKPCYRDNFSKQFLTTFSEKNMDFNKFNFWPIKEHLEAQKEIRKNRSKEEKKSEKDRKDQLANFYAGAILDFYREKVGQYMIEPPTLFKGRGEHPKMGLMKGRIQPEAVVINIAKDAPIPKCIVAGHAWGDIVHKQDVTWLASYKDNSVKKQHKYFFLSAESRLKAENDKKKYEKARKLKNVIGQIRENYEMKLKSSNEVDRQLGTATYLIDKLALRVGNEKSEEEADTVGCCSLRIEHIQVLDDCQISFDFLGKDSMRYQNTVKVNEIVWKNISQFIKNKKDDQNLFDKIDASSLNEYLKSQMKGLTAKVFRTYNASHTLQKELDMAVSTKMNKMDLKEKLNFYDEANRNVAILCNHQKTVGKNFDQMLNRMEQRLKAYKDYEKELLDHLNKCKKKDVKEYEEETILEEREDGKHKMLTKKFPSSADKTQEALEKIRKKINEEKNKKDNKEKNKEIALGTSKTNYNDPRISVNFCKKWDVPIEKVFPRTLCAKFVWAMETDLDWNF
ncbi:hypothetical protein IMG5_083110 [Ichthyophthirius multifiliis]|uniref:DNA topoisomerase I n=1 Tax=Ichthyophthirius multifiliis TaxID=5932 RepID=G0QQR2_ICHMU|nr:hypothetical protein IMG5_083110 [Ichthyophthirius multifiliis]EGR32433.1 hypothetical protein IMG5_083110 [Ichthyophthirius multifiliis]|eukprot:XP_004036419.1 hypothetical protein IMG5_083110 [Ichthyophthirius multifiliis]